MSYIWCTIGRQTGRPDDRSSEGARSTRGESLRSLRKGIRVVVHRPGARRSVFVILAALLVALDMPAAFAEDGVPGGGVSPTPSDPPTSPLVTATVPVPIIDQPLITATTAPRTPARTTAPEVSPSIRPSATPPPGPEVIPAVGETVPAGAPVPVPTPVDTPTPIDTLTPDLTPTPVITPTPRRSSPAPHRSAPSVAPVAPVSPTESVAGPGRPQSGPWRGEPAVDGSPVIVQALTVLALLLAGALYFRLLKAPGALSRRSTGGRP